MPALKNHRWELFCREFIVDLHRQKAAIRAGFAKKGAHVTGCRLLKNPKIAERISELKAERSRITGVDAEYVLTRLYRDVEADLADLYDDDGALKPINEWPIVWRQGLVSGLDTVNVGEAGETKITKLRLSDRTQRMKLLGDHVDVQAFKENIGVEDRGDLAGKMERAMARIARMHDE